MKLKMIHKLAIIGAVLGLSLPAYSRIYFGTRAGISHTSLVQKRDLDYRSGWKIGGSVAGLMDIPVYERFSFRPELAFVYQGGSFVSGSDVENTYKWDNNFKGYSLQPSFNLAFNIPISDVKMTIFLGPALDFHLNDRLTVKQNADDNDRLDQWIKKFDFSINSGISVEYKGAFFQISSLSGLTDRRTVKVENESPVYQNNLTFSLGYFFR
jgi:hypothetical protein